MPDRRLDEEEIFHVARKITDPETQAKYLDQICAGDQPLRERVEALLKVHEQEQAFLKPEAESAADRGVSRRSPRGRAMRSVATGCWSRSAKGDWASCSWPNRSDPFVARWH